MNRKIFGALVSELRAELGISQEDLAELLDKHVNTVQNLEGGKHRYVPDVNILLGLAEALKLTTMERREFFFAALGLGMEQVVRHPYKDVSDLNELLENVKTLQTPAFINDCYGNIVAANQSVIQFLHVTPEFIAKAYDLEAGYNVMNIIFSEESGYGSLVGDKWNESMLRNMLFFRRITFRYRHEKGLQKIIKALRTNKNFENFWKSTAGITDDTDSDYELYEYLHPALNNPVKYLSTISTVITGDGELYLINYVPTDKHTTTMFQKIVDDVGTEWVRFAPWPRQSD